jgi:hypothetical protein
MNHEKVSEVVQSILIEHFNILEGSFSWEQPLDKLQADFKILDYLIFLERLLQSKLKKEFSLLENISTAIHSPSDIVHLIMKVFENELDETVFD